ncbi:cytochrome P450 [Xanthobacter sp. ZOL 2024]
MSVFIPPFPPRPEKALSIVEMLRRGSTNFISIFEESAFVHQTMSLQVLTRQVFICNSPESINEAFVEKAANFERKSPQIRSGLAPLIGDALAISDGPAWAQRRALVEGVLSVSRTQALLPEVLAIVDAVTADWPQGPQAQDIDMLDATATLSARIIGGLLFGPSFGAAEAAAIRAAIADYQKHTDRSDLPLLLGLPSWKPFRQNTPILRSAGAVHALFERLLAASLDSGSGLACVLRDSGQLDPTALRNELISLYLGGDDTVGALLAWVFYLVSQARDVEARLEEELYAFVGPQLKPAEELARLPFVRAILCEAARLYPPVPMFARQAQAADEINKRKISAGALVVVIPWLLHRHRNLWHEPDLFQPERFLPNARRKLRENAFVAFSIGPRACPGAALGLAEAAVCVAALSHRYQFRLKPGTVVEPVCHHTLRPSPGLPMRVQRRVLPTGVRVPAPRAS